MSEEAPVINAQRSVPQLFRYVLVGLLSNAAGYLVYLVLTYYDGTPKLTMSLLYWVSAAVGFFGNRNLTFEHQGSILGAGIRYGIAHCIGYLLNLSMLVVFVDKLAFPHQWIQGVAIFAVAAFLFLAFKVFVFPVSGDGAR